MVITSQAGLSVPPSIGRTLKLRHISDNGYEDPSIGANSDGARNRFEEKTTAPSSDDESKLNRLASDVEAQQGDIQKLNSIGNEVVSSFNNSMKRIEEAAMKLKSNVSQTQRDLVSSTSKTDVIEKKMTSLEDKVEEVKQSSQSTAHFDRLEEAVSNAGKAITKVRKDLTSDIQRCEGSLQQERNAWKEELDTARNDIECLRRELDDTKKIARESVSTAKTYAEDVVSLRAEVELLREELSRNPPQRNLSGDGTFPSREIDILTSSITRVSQRASQVEPLQMEFELLKGRVQRMESQKEAIRDGIPEAHQQKGVAPSIDSPKRKWSSTFPGQNTLTPDGSNYSQAEGSAVSKGSNESTSLPPSTGTQLTNLGVPSSLRLTKSGAIDKRSLKRIKSSASARKNRRVEGTNIR